MNGLQLRRREGTLRQQIGAVLLLRSTCNQTGYAFRQLSVVSVGSLAQASRV
jgi:hypothetical protein